MLKRYSNTFESFNVMLSLHGRKKFFKNYRLCSEVEDMRKSREIFKKEIKILKQISEKFEIMSI